MDQVREFVLQLAQDAMDAERVQTSPETESGSETGTEPDRKPRPGPEPEPCIQPETEPIHPHEYLKATHTNYDLGEKSQEGTTTTSRAVADPTNNTELTNETVQRHPAKKAKDDRPEQASQPACAGPARATKMKDITIEPENLPEVTTMKDGSGNNAQGDRVRARDTIKAEARIGSRTKNRTDTGRARAKERARARERARPGLQVRTGITPEKEPEPTTHLEPRRSTRHGGPHHPSAHPTATRQTRSPQPPSHKGQANMSMEP